MNEFYNLFKIYAGPLAYTLIAFEFILCSLRREKIVYWKDSATNIFMIYIGGFTRELIFLAFPLPIITLLCQEITFKWEYTILAWFCSFFLLDFLEYWSHRWAHENQFLWIFHNVHHSAEEFNFTTGGRQSWIVEIYRFLFLIPLALAGFPLWMILVCRALHRYLQLFQHTTIVPKLGPIEFLFATPSAHRVHHGRNPHYINKNYGNILCIWDRIFQTYEPEVIPVEFGPQSDIPRSYNPFVIQFIEPYRLFRELQKKKKLKEHLKYLVSTPGSDKMKSGIT